MKRFVFLILALVSGEALADQAWVQYYYWNGQLHARVYYDTWPNALNRTQRPTVAVDPVMPQTRYNDPRYGRPTIAVDPVMPRRSETQYEPRYGDPRYGGRQVPAVDPSYREKSLQEMRAEFQPGGELYEMLQDIKRNTRR
jgi:hypothetical protein